MCFIYFFSLNLFYKSCVSISMGILYRVKFSQNNSVSVQLLGYVRVVRYRVKFFFHNLFIFFAAAFFQFFFSAFLFFHVFSIFENNQLIN